MYKKPKDTFLLSVFTGLIIVLIVNGGATILDIIGVNVKLATFIALCVGLIVNFILQLKIFSVKSGTTYKYMILMYLITDAIVLITNQILFSYAVDYKKEITPYLPSILVSKYLLFIRLLTGGFVWCILAYPLRKYWVFV